jgi:dolichol-phosphate mannosyltransferase
LKKLLSLVVPVYFEQECIEQFVDETQRVLDALPLEYEIVFVDDGSTDETVCRIRRRAQGDQRIKLIEFSYNHGKAAAVSAGIRYARGDYLLYMDPDLQDPPLEIPRFVAEIEKGYDLVFGVRRAKKDTLLNRLASQLFWYTLDKLTNLKLPKGLAVMRIFNRRFAEQFLKYSEQNRFIEGIFMHIGMKQATLEIEQRDRFAGVSKFNFRRKFNLAFNAILDFSDLPLKIAVRLGLAISGLGILAIMVVIVLKLTLVDFQAGWPSLVSVMATGFGLQTFFTGLSALYIGRIYRETKRRPLFSISEYTNISLDHLQHGSCASTDGETG